jgi:hypothetical protein
MRLPIVLDPEVRRRECAKSEGPLFCLHSFRMGCSILYRPGFISGRMLGVIDITGSPGAKHVGGTAMRAEQSPTAIATKMACPLCGENMRLVLVTPHPDDKPLNRHTFGCTCCSETRTYVFDRAVGFAGLAKASAAASPSPFSSAPPGPPSFLARLGWRPRRPRPSSFLQAFPP